MFHEMRNESEKASEEKLSANLIKSETIPLDEMLEKGKVVGRFA